MTQADGEWDTIGVKVYDVNPASRTIPENIPATENVTVTVRLPDFLPSVTAFEVTPDGETSIPCTTDGGTAVFKIDAIATSRVFVLRRK